MPVSIICPSCDAKLKAADESARRKAARCPKCKGVIPPSAPAPAVKANGKGNDAVAAAPKPTPPPAKAAPANKPRREKPAAPARPESTLDQDCADTELFAESGWMIRNKERFLLGAWFRVRYDVFRLGTKEIIGLVEERNPLWVSILGANNTIRQFLPRRFELRDADDRVLLRMRTPGAGLMGLVMLARPGKMFVFDAEDEPIGTYLLATKFFGTPSLALVGPDEEKLGDFKFQMANIKEGIPPRMALVGPEGQEWGSVTGEEIMEAINDAKRAKEGGPKVTFSFKFLPPPPGLHTTMEPDYGDDVLPKALLLAGAAALKVFRIDAIFKR